MAMMVATHPSKRQRTDAPPREFHINDIPVEALTVVAKFLPKSSQALFAVAITAPPPSWRRRESEESEKAKGHVPSPACQAILSVNPTPEISGLRCCPTTHCLSKQRDETWSTLDFADLEPSLAKRLTDDHLAAILTCIDAQRKLRILKLTGCVSLTGHGLDPLRGSVVLQQIDLSLVGKHDSPTIVPPPRIEEAAVLPFLDSIVDAEGNSLKQLQLPKKLRSCPPSEPMEDFVFKYDAFMEKLGGACTKCKCEDANWGNENINGNPWFIDDEEGQFYGCQNFTCYECLGNFCVTQCVGHCMDCEKAFCTDCVPILECNGCNQEKCRECWAKNNCNC